MSRRQSVLVVAVAICITVIGGVVVYGQSLRQVRARSSILQPRLSNITIGDTPLQVMKALTPAEQSQGLSGTQSLATDSGMLFDFGSDVPSDMWMKDMNFPLDFIWIASDDRVVGVTPNVSPASYPATFRPPSPSRYVVEVNAGWAAAHHVAAGDYLRWH